jgi:hypothetical protein
LPLTWAQGIECLMHILLHWYSIQHFFSCLSAGISCDLLKMEASSRLSSRTGRTCEMQNVNETAPGKSCLCYQFCYQEIHYTLGGLLPPQLVWQAYQCPLLFPR